MLGDTLCTGFDAALILSLFRAKSINIALELLGLQLPILRNNWRRQRSLGSAKRIRLGCKIVVLLPTALTSSLINYEINVWLLH
ncbi:hypothetical protein J6590_066296 [Homalodisca vitripennis]|nr:hypothetical protein J6590_066296 [Homalodisca vitripennis]